MDTLLNATFFGWTWWKALLWLGFIIYWMVVGWATLQAFHWEYRDRFNRWGLVNQREKHKPSFRAALRDSLYDDQEYFRLWDIVRTVIALPGLALGLIFFLLYHGAWQLLPIWRVIFGIKLFKLKK